MRPPRFPTVFEALVNAIACQQLSLTVGIHLLNRLARHYGDSAFRAADGPRAFPTPERLASADPDDLRALGFSRAKARAVVALAEPSGGGELDLEALCGADDDRARTVLLGHRGSRALERRVRAAARIGSSPGTARRRRRGPQQSAQTIRPRRVRRIRRAVGELARSWWPYGGLVYFHLLLDALAEAGHVAPTTIGPPRGSSSGRRGRRTSIQE